MNLLTAIGNIARDAEVRYMANGDPIASFSFALNSGYGDKQITTWLSCSLFGKRATTLAPMLLKGTKIGISGELTNRPYTAKDGTEKYSLDLRVNDVTLLGAKPAQEQSQAPANKTADFDDFDEVVPF
jgi:single-strand DNA-binding protein